MYQYSGWQWLLIFYIYCFVGWCFESTVVSVQQKRPVNRGFLRGPMLPIYGFGATLLLHISLPLYHHPVQLFFWSMVCATVFEYLVGAVMEKLFKIKYWDYSEHRFQFQGLICLQSSLCWGLLGLVLARFIHPPIETFVIRLPFGLLLALTLVLSALFVSDVVVSVRAALDLAHVLEELDKLREQADEVRAKLSESAMVGLTNLSYRVDEARGEFSERMADAKEQLTERAADAKEQLTDAKEQLTERAADAKEQLQQTLDDMQRNFEERAKNLGYLRKSLLRGNPSAKSTQYNDVLQRLKTHVTRKKRG